MEIKCEKTATTGVQIFVDGEYLTTFRYFPECDNFIELIENAQKYKNKCVLAKNTPTNQEQLAAPAVIKSVCCDKCKKELKPIYLCTNCLKDEMDKKQTVL